MDKQRFLRDLERALGNVDIIDAAAVAKIDALLWVLYPNGVKPEQYADLVHAVRVLDHLCATARAADERRDLAACPAPDEAVVQAVEDDATAPISTREFLPATETASKRPWTSLGEFSLTSKTSPERRLLVAHYAALLKPAGTREDDAIVITPGAPIEASGG